MPVASSPLIELSPGLMIWTLVCFFIVFVVLKKFAFGRIQGIIDARNELIRNSVEEAEKTRDQVEQLLVEHKALLEQARAQGEEIVTDARKVADSMADRVQAEVEADRQRRLEDTSKQIAAETQRALDRIRAEMAELTLVATAKVTGKVLDAADHKRLIEEAVSELDFSAFEESTT